jgi:hypothetical protein
MSRTAAAAEVVDWPALPYVEWKDTLTTLHLWTQIVGKIRLALSPWTNHSWHVPLYVTARGLTTSPIPYGTSTFEVTFDFLDQRLRIDTSDRGGAELPLVPRSVADFYRELFARMAGLGIEIGIRTLPNEIPDAIPFEQDHEHANYDGEQATRFWRALLQADRVFKTFRARFIGKASPVHFFWGSFDLAVTRFSGRRAPSHPGGVPNLPDWVAREAYSHEVSSCGFWPGGGAEGAFYSYAYPEPPGFQAWPVLPEQAVYDMELGEFLLPYEVVRTSEDPDATLMAFLQCTYESAAELAAWDRNALEVSAAVYARS